MLALLRSRCPPLEWAGSSLRSRSSAIESAGSPVFCHLTQRPLNQGRGGTRPYRVARLHLRSSSLAGGNDFRHVHPPSLLGTTSTPPILTFGLLSTTRNPGSRPPQHVSSIRMGGAHSDLWTSRCRAQSASKTAAVLVWLFQSQRDCITQPGVGAARAYPG